MQMRGLLRRTALAVGIIAIVSAARAEGFSTSAVNPSPVAPTGLIAGNFPAGEGETSLYFAVDLKAGQLVTQSSFLGRPDRDKYLEFNLKDPKGKLLSYYTIMSGLDANQEATRVFPVDSSGRYMVVVKTKGPETTTFQVALGGSAFPAQPAASASAGSFSQSYLAPSPLPKDGVITGTAPGGEKKITYYYFATNLKPGDLLTQISFAGRRNAPKKLEFALLDAQARAGANSNYYIMGELNANDEKTRAFPIDSSGRYVLRVGVSGVEGTRYKVELGGSAFPMN
jgi:hypothetical protein